jgi:Family of unknown function (DUF5989)
MSLLKELWLYVNARKKFWLAPIILIMLFLAVFMVFAQASVFAPFIYSLF